MTETVCTADLCDASVPGLRIPDAAFRNFGAVAQAAGEVRLVRLHDDNRLLFDVVDELGGGRILVVSVESPDRPAVVGENVALRALEKGWGGILIDGAVRDSIILATIALPIAARETRPFRLRTENRGEIVNELAVGGVIVRSGDWVAFDEDGVVFYKPDAP